MIIVFITRYEISLRTPMYFFLGNFSLLEICFTSVTVPTILADLIRGENIVSFTNCLVQIYFFHALGGIECLLLAAMAYDRYVAIHSPLRYNIIMSSVVYGQLAAWSWATGLVLPLIPVILISQLNYCGTNVVDHFFCDILPLLRLVCNRTQLNEMLSFFICTFILVGSFTLTVVSYAAILITVMGIHSSDGRKKAFSTFASHLTVGILQRLANGNVTVKCHDCQKETFSTHKGKEKIQLEKTAYVRDATFLLKKEIQHLGNSGSSVADIQKGEVPKEEIHGGSEPLIQCGYDDNESVPQHCEQINGQESTEEQEVYLLQIFKPKDDEFQRFCLVMFFQV
ncbi:hypothetical protein JD844_001730 [Phrynosoma platyrhinos]|uniref:G-protein coupled receptors family 1 profile domain-containing protein n=1 Tax=Phrynosoma platyrhinos TaxID=52577 RepID=A0ABQ7TA80_PHRPL|nr:hypothetical protein JD844_001730 [Phrynosoma platyrhinos]